MSQPKQQQQWHSTFSIPYPPYRSRRNTLDVHRPVSASAPREPGYWIVYLHGGAFRDPAQTPHQLLPSLPHIFHATHHIAGVVSLGYRLCSYPNHDSDPWPPRDHRDDGKEGRGIRWPAGMEDVREGIGWLADGDGSGGGEGEGEGKGCLANQQWIVVGYSVGATMAMVLAMSNPRAGDGKWGADMALSGRVMEGLVGVVGVEGIFDFVGLRDNHWGGRSVYEVFTRAAFGNEEDGGWRRGDLIANGEVVRRGVRVVVLGHSAGDELVEEGQSGRMAEAVGVGARYAHGGLEVRRVEVEGGHDEVVEKGVGVGRCVDVAVQALRERHSDG